MGVAAMMGVATEQAKAKKHNAIITLMGAPFGAQYRQDSPQDLVPESLLVHLAGPNAWLVNFAIRVE